jgi:SAM-dependent methyltransferase
MPAVSERPPARVLLGVGMLAGATLALQVLITRILAAVLLYHFGFLAISLALVGVGGGAILVYVRPGWFERVPLERALARWSLGFAAALAIGLFVLVRIDYSYTGLDVDFALRLGLACLVTAIPFLVAGVAIALAVRGYVRGMGRLYAADLAGGAAGAALVVPLMWVVDAPTLAVGLTAVACAAALLFAGRAAEGRAALAGLGAAALLVVLSASTSAFYLSIGGPRPEAERWTPLSRVSAYLPGGPGGDRGVVIYDRVIAEVLRYQGGAYPDWRATQEGPESIGYELTPRRDALVIGGGGGRDVLTALAAGYRNVDVIELNSGIRDIVGDDLASYTRSPYELPGVSTTIGDGRSEIADSDKGYDQIQIGFTDTFSPNAAHAFALTENNLYTVEAFREYIRHLKPGGVLKVSRPRSDFGDQALRITILALDALREEGVADPSRNVAVVLGDYDAPFRSYVYGTVLVKKTPFEPAELARIRALARERGRGVVYAPGGPYVSEWAALQRASSPASFCAGWRTDVCSPTDDEPFFFHMKRVSDVFGGEGQRAGTVTIPDPLLLLLIALGLLLALCALAFALPLALVRRERRPPAAALSFFAAIGVGFLVLEVVLIQRLVLFLGFPTYALSVVLFALLLFTGLGSLLTTRPGLGGRRALTAALTAAGAMIAAVAFGLGPLLHALIDQPFAARLAVSVLVLAPLGLALGAAMPIGLRRVDALWPAAVPWAWGINGVTSVVASVLAVAVAVTAGFTVATLVSLGCYLVALAGAVFGPWPDEAVLDLD